MREVKTIGEGLTRSECRCCMAIYRHLANYRCTMEIETTLEVYEPPSERLTFSDLLRLRSNLSEE
jgi:hypothetical protein